jgi:hypothetical protein
MQESDSTPLNAAADTFVPVELVERSSLNRQTDNSCTGLYIEMVNSLRIGVASGFDAATLTRLIVSIRPTPFFRRLSICVEVDA